MNILGKILTWLVVVVAAVDIVFAARLLQIRNSWTRQLEELKKDNDDRADRLAALTRRQDALQRESDRVMVGWEAYWDPVPAQRGIQGNVLVAGIGTAHGVGVDVSVGEPPQPARLRSQIHAFQPVQNGYRYVGPFRLSGARQTESEWVPMWTPRRGEVNSWAQGDRWRFRSVVPAPYPNLLTGYYSQLELVDVEIQQATDALEGIPQQDGPPLGGKKQAIAAAEDEINHYMQVLRGDPNAGGAGGLVQELLQVEETRNDILGDVDRLRRDLKVTNDRIEELVPGNKKLAEQLKEPVRQPASAEIAPGT